MNEHLMRAVVLLCWHVDSQETTDPDHDVKVLEGIVAELDRLSDEDRARLVRFVRAEAEQAGASPFESDQRYAVFLRDFPEGFGLVEPLEEPK
jgi:hypothetical protein